MRWAVYDLRQAPPSFDFIAFLVLARAHGADGVLFIPGFAKHKALQYSAEEQAERVKNICHAACELYGFPFKEIQLNDSYLEDVCWPPYYTGSKRVNFHGYAMGWFKSLKSPEAIQPTSEALSKARQKVGSDRIVVHIRNVSYQKQRNSGPDWVRWAKKHNAYVLDDVPMPLDERLAFHEAASLNIGVNAGPMYLSELSTHRPYITMKRLCNTISTNEVWFNEQGWKLGDQYPWAGKHQMIVWDARDDFEAIENAFKEWECQSSSTTTLRAA